MAYSICLNINLKKYSLLLNDNLIKNAAYNTNCNNIYMDYELEGINNYIKKNNKIIILEYEYLYDFLNFLNFIIKIRDISIDYIYNNNSILYYSNKYFNSLDKHIYDKDLLKINVENNKKINKYNEIYKILL